MLSLALCGPVAEGFGVFAPVEKGDHGLRQIPLEKVNYRGSEATWLPPAAEGAVKLSQSFHSPAKWDQGTPPFSKCTRPRPLVSATGMDWTLVCNNTYCVCISPQSTPLRFCRREQSGLATCGKTTVRRQCADG